MNIIDYFHEQGQDYEKIYGQKIHKYLKDRAISFSERGFYSINNLVLSTNDRIRNWILQ